MKKSLSIVLTILSVNIFAQYTLTITNGYGGGNYNAGDTIDIWCAAIPSDKVFDNWTGNTSTLESNDEWHTTLVIPSQNISVAAIFAL